MATDKTDFGWIILAIVGASTTGCAVAADGDEDARELLQPSQCGTTWDGEGVEQLSGDLLVSSSYVNEHSRPVARIGGCSGTLLPGNYFLTAAHCFSASNPPSSVRFNYQRSPGGSLRSSDYYSVSQVVEHQNGGVDYAIVRLSGNPSADYPPAQLAGARPAVGSTISIIGHPQGRPKEVATGHVYNYTSSRIRYADLDTLGGNSGSGVFDGFTGELIAVHTNGGCRTNGGANSGWHIERLLEVSPTLRGILADGGGGGGQQGDCDPGEAEFDDHCYALTGSGSSHANAQSQCESRGDGWGLAEVGSSSENSFLVSLAGGAEAWLGASDQSSEGTFEWASGDVFWSGGLSGGPVGGAYSNFISSEPNDGGGNSDCLRMVSGGGWRDISCSSNYRGLCESDLSSPPPPPPAPSCNDGVQNGSETDVDCGGSECGTCQNGDSCNQDNDCNSDNCSGGTCASEPPPPPPTGGDFSGEIVIRDEWEAGYCADVVLTNDSSAAVNGWTVQIDLNQATMGGSWNAQVSQSGGTVTATPSGWNASVSSGSTLNAWGYCASKSGNNWEPDLTNVTAN